MNAYILVGLGLLFALACYEYVRSQRQRGLDAAWEAQYPREAFEYCGKTLLFYEDSHGNQVEYLAPTGRCYLLYPGNSVVLKGRWRCDESYIYFQYGSNTYNPVTGVTGGEWEPQLITWWSASIVDAVPGDILELQRRLPFILAPRPALGSIRDLTEPDQQQ